MSVEVFGVKEIRIRKFTAKPGEFRESFWLDTVTEGEDHVNITLRIAPKAFIRQMRKVLSELELSVLKNEDFDMTISYNEVLEDATRPKTETTGV